MKFIERYDHEQIITDVDDESASGLFVSAKYSTEAINI